MVLLLTAIILFAVTGAAAMATGRHSRLAGTLAVGGVVGGGVLGLVPVLRCLLSGEVLSICLPWNVPWGSFSVSLDALSAWFLLPVLVLSILAAIYGRQYFKPYEQSRSLGGPWFFFNLLAASMCMVVIARNAVLFVVAWEIMSLASFFLVTFEDEKESVRQAGWTYLLATHMGTAFLLVLFVLMGRQSGSLDFDRLAAFGSGGGTLTSVAFVLAIIGFGTKAGFVPLHVWLPEAHPAAPSHVSAVMSGVMIKMGIYGLVRTLTFLGTPLHWWGWLLVGIGLVSGVWGVLMALAQHDLKRLLAYHSVENIGIITLGLGVGVLGVCEHSQTLEVLGFAGALLHVVNHAFFKGLLFLGAGAVAHASGTRDIDRLGGLLKKMPWTAATFLIASVAICGIPPLNGFVSEFLIYLASLHGAARQTAPAAIPCLLAIGALAMIGGLAAACFSKAFGIIFLGEPRATLAAVPHEVGPAMRLSMAALAGGCVLIGLLCPLVLRCLHHPLAALCGPGHHAEIIATLDDGAAILAHIVGASALLVLLIVGLALLRRRLLRGRTVRAAGTWDCGYAAPNPRMQYTASSYAQPLTDLFHLFLHTRRTARTPQGLFPSAASMETDTDDLFRQNVFAPAFRGIGWVVSHLRWLQQGRIQLYVLYIALTLLVLLIWKL